MAASPASSMSRSISTSRRSGSRPARALDIEFVIACDKREAFAQGSEATKQSMAQQAERWIASRSLSSGAHSRDPLARNDDTLPGGLLWPPDVLAQGLELLARGAGSIAFDLAVARNQRRAERRQDGAAAVLAAGLPCHRGLAADSIDFIDQIPRALVGHVHRAAGRRDRAAGFDILQQLDLAWSDPPIVRQIDPDAQGRQ